MNAQAMQPNEGPQNERKKSTTEWTDNVTYERKKQNTQKKQKNKKQKKNTVIEQAKCEPNK